MIRFDQVVSFGICIVLIEPDALQHHAIEKTTVVIPSSILVKAEVIKSHPEWPLKIDTQESGAADYWIRGSYKSDKGRRALSGKVTIPADLSCSEQFKITTKEGKVIYHIPFDLTQADRREASRNSQCASLFFDAIAKIVAEQNA